MNHRIFLLFFFLFGLNFYSNAQDTIVLLSGKTIIAKNIAVGMYSVTYYSLKENSWQKRIGPESVFSIKHADGTERIVYERDSLEEEDYTVEQMRMYVRGEQDAMKYYKNNVNKIAAFACGGVASFFGFYGLIGPAIYSTVSGSVSPIMEKQKVSDPVLLHADEYREGYQRKVRDKKVKSSILYGIAGFAATFAAISIATHN